MDINAIRDIVLNKIDMSLETDDETIKEVIDNVLLEESDDIYLSLDDKIKIRKSVFDSIKGMDVLSRILKDEEITEVMINGVKDIFIEKNGSIEKYEGEFSTKERLLDIIQKIVTRVNRRVNESSPIVDTRLIDGSRVNIVLEPVAINGPVVTIRRFPDKSITMDELVSFKTIDKECKEFIRALIKAKYNIIFCGSTGCGKTTFLNAVSAFIGEDERVITIEDLCELKIQNVKNLVSLEAREKNIEGENEISIRTLIKTSLRMRPDRIIVGEVRDGAALDMLQAMNTGHDGSLSTAHANSPKDMINRLEVMVSMGSDLSINAIRGQIISGVDIIIHLGRMRDKTRKLLEIVEVDGGNGEVKLRSICKFVEDIKEDKGKGSSVSGRFVWNEEGLKNTEKLLRAGLFDEEKKYGAHN